MPIKTIYCPNCRKAYGVQEDAYTYFECVVCGTIVQNNANVEQTNTPNPTGYRREMRTVQDTANWPNDQPVKPQRQESRSVWSEIGAGALLIGAIFCVIGFVFVPIYNHFKKPDTAQSVNQTPVTHNEALQQPVGTISAQQNRDINPSPQYELCKVRLVNTFTGTDKTGEFKALSDTVNKTLTLTYINNPNEYLVLNYMGKGVCNLRLYTDGQMQIEKEMYRRSDLEHSSTEMVYTSRTTEVQLIITY